MHKVLVVEDFPDDAELLKEELGRWGVRHGFDFDVSWSQTATALASGNRSWDLVFLDIELPGINGMEAAELMRTWDAGTPIIFTTSLSQYAVKGYEVGAAGFIVKPVTQPKLEMCMDKVVGSLRRTGQNRIVLPQGSGVRVIPVNELYYVDLVRHDLVFRLAGSDEPVKVRGTVRQLLEAAPEDAPLLQISSGCVANMDYIRLIKGSEVVMADGTALPLSRARKKDALEAFAAYMGRTF